ncbi:ectoine/hydroxyectoine ABC transporter substrate-binding protein EhuB [Bradyrhizobium sp. ma5]|uniref:ectoine/hydroxyectoine ABC transporter substrate-binding protein EhuB n=1 Tax=Bradyrhizobium sp. ma5 TaxID=3344828 RepID=UPI0035D526A7
MSLRKLLVSAAICFASTATSPQRAYSETLTDRIMQEGRTTIGIFNQPPWGFKTDTGEVAGVHPDMLRTVLGPAGVKKVDFVVVEWGALIPGLMSHRFDVIATGLGITPTRCEQVTFSEPDLAIRDALIVKKGNPLNIHSFADIAANPKIQLATGRGSTSNDNALKAGVLKSQIQQFPGDAPTLLSAIYSGRVDAIAASSGTLIAYLSDPNVKGLERAMPFTGYVEHGHEATVYIAMAFRLEDVALRDLYNENFTKRIADGTVDKVLTKYGFTAADVAPHGITTRDLCGQKYR